MRKNDKRSHKNTYEYVLDHYLDTLMIHISYICNFYNKNSRVLSQNIKIYHRQNNYKIFFVIFIYKYLFCISIHFKFQ